MSDDAVTLVSTSGDSFVVDASALVASNVLTAMVDGACLSE